MKIILTPQQKQQLEEMHGSTRDGRVRDRIKARAGAYFDGCPIIIVS